MGVPAGLEFGAKGANIGDHRGKLLERPGAKKPVVGWRIAGRVPKDWVQGDAGEARTYGQAFSSRDKAVPGPGTRSAGRGPPGLPRGLADVALRSLPISPRAKGHGLIEAPREGSAYMRVGVGDAPHFGEVGKVEVGTVGARIMLRPRAEVPPDDLFPGLVQGASAAAAPPNAVVPELLNVTADEADVHGEVRIVRIERGVLRAAATTTAAGSASARAAAATSPLGARTAGSAGVLLGGCTAVLRRIISPWALGRIGGAVVVAGMTARKGSGSGGRLGGRWRAGRIPVAPGDPGVRVGVKGGGKPLDHAHRRCARYLGRAQEGRDPVGADLARVRGRPGLVRGEVERAPDAREMRVALQRGGQDIESGGGWKLGHGDVGPGPRGAAPFGSRASGKASSRAGAARGARRWVRRGVKAAAQARRG